MNSNKITYFYMSGCPYCRHADNAIEELIKEKCPDGVKYKTLGELGHFYGGLTGKTKDDFTNGNAIFITYKNVYSNLSLDVNPIMIKTAMKKA